MFYFLLYNTSFHLASRSIIFERKKKHCRNHGEKICNLCYIKWFLYPMTKRKNYLYLWQTFNWEFHLCLWVLNKSISITSRPIYPLSPWLFSPSNFMCSVLNSLSALSSAFLYISARPFTGAQTASARPHTWRKLTLSPSSPQLAKLLAKSSSARYGTLWTPPPPMLKCLAGLVLYRFCACSHNHCEFMCATAQCCQMFTTLHLSLSSMILEP